MPTILACTDGSTFAPSIYQHAAWAARQLNAGVEVLHVLVHHREHSPIADLSGAIGMDASVHLTEELTRVEEAQSREARHKGKAILEDARQQLRAAGVTDITLTQRHGDVVETLAELEPRAELIVVGKSGEHAVLADGQVGGHLENLVRLSVRPVLVAERAFQPVKRFLLAYDHSPSARKAVDYGGRRARVRAPGRPRAAGPRRLHRHRATAARQGGRRHRRPGEAREHRPAGDGCLRPLADPGILRRQHHHEAGPHQPRQRADVPVIRGLTAAGERSTARFLAICRRSRRCWKNGYASCGQPSAC
jgi:hypothetical protein